MYNRFVVIDVETTGNLAKKGDRIIQVAAVLIEDNQIIEQFSSFVNPGVEIPLFIEKLTGINQEMVEDAPDFDEIAPRLVQMLDKACFVAHNVPFDLSFIDEELINSGYCEFTGPSLDTVEMSRLLLPTLDGYKLNQLSEYLDIEHINPHRADSDAEVTARLLLLLLEKLEDLPLQTLKQLKPLVKHFQSDLEPVVTDVIQKKEMKIEEYNPHLDYYRQLILKMPNTKEEELNSVEFGTYREAVEQLPDVMTKFEARDGQLEMMDIVETAFNTQSHALIEAGTGIGKSLGYLIPAVIQAKKTGRPIVVSTHTIQLQQQLLERDIPILEKIFPFHVEATIIKGRNHYLCLRKFEQYLSTINEDTYDAIFSKAQILVWLVNTEYGDVEELSLPSGGKLLWPVVRSDSNSCLNHKCPWYSRCFYHRSKRKANQADIIITNHSLLFTDLLSENSLLPSYKEVIMDEAHHLEDVVSKQFGIQTDYHSFLRIIDRIGYLDGQNSNFRIFVELLKTFEAPEELIQTLSETNDQLKSTKFEIDDLFRMIKNFAITKSKNIEGPRLTLRFKEENEELLNGHIQMKDVVERVSYQIKDIVKSLNIMFDFLNDKIELMTVYQKGQLVDFKGFVSSLGDELQKLKYILLTRSDSEVSWIETDSKGPANTAHLYSQPVDIRELLTENFFMKKNSVIMTSATLTIKNSFEYMEKRLGLEALPVMTRSISSPFDYTSQAKIFVPSDIPMIKDVPQKVYVEHISDVIEKIAYVTNGKMLVLFTSYEMLRGAYYILKEALADDYNLIGQGIDGGSRSKLTKNFKQYENAILFGTSSFWEGVDIPGDDLSCIVIVRLPFSPPDDPIAEARSERIKQNGKNPFMDLSLPEAIIRFKQGFGRLIRTKDDRGVVFVLDQRILKTRYGKNFINSLPNVPIESGTIEQLLTNLQDWIKKPEHKA